jgi:hypothetical protein
MANAHRGETDFSAGGREYYLVYGTWEIAEMQSRLGFHRPDPYAPVTWEEVEQKDGQKVRVELTWAERNSRMLTAFDGTFTNPSPADLRTMVRIGLRRWEKLNGTLSEAQFESICDALGLVGLQTLHLQAVTNGLRASGPEDATEPKRAAAPASSTSSGS